MQASRGFVLCVGGVGGIRREAGVSRHGRFFRGLFSSGRLRTRSHRPLHEVIHKLMQAFLPAEVFGVCAGPAAYIQSAQAQLARNLESHKPMVGLTLLGSTYIARYGLSDQSIAPAHKLNVKGTTRPVLRSRQSGAKGSRARRSPRSGSFTEPEQLEWSCFYFIVPRDANERQWKKLFPCGAKPESASM
jgi:hypothetical protein